jgi:hypothetical protein
MVTPKHYKSIQAVRALPLKVHGAVATGALLLATLGLGLLQFSGFFAIEYSASSPAVSTTTAGADAEDVSPDPEPTLDKSKYRSRMHELVNDPQQATTTRATSTATTSKPAQPQDWPWPVEPFVYPKPGAVLPFERVVAYYGNFYSQNMGILGKYEPERVLERLSEQVSEWEQADPDTPVTPAIHYIAVTAQRRAGEDGMYRLRMPFDQIEKAHEMAEQIDGELFLDIQVGMSTLEQEVPRLKPYLKKPNVHLAIDPEFSMKEGGRPGHRIGTYDAADINYVTSYLADLVDEYDLPPKMLVVHRFTQNMVTNYDKIERRPQVQVVMHMDGWGPPHLKRGTYRRVIQDEPVQFTGFKVFYENDRRPPSPGIMQPEDILKLQPEPIYIQYQ